MYRVVAQFIDDDQSSWLTHAAWSYRMIIIFLKLHHHDLSIFIWQDYLQCFATFAKFCKELWNSWQCLQYFSRRGLFRESFICCRTRCQLLKIPNRLWTKIWIFYLLTLSSPSPAFQLEWRKHRKSAKLLWRHNIELSLGLLVFLSFCLFVFLSFCQVSKITISVKILKWRWLTDSLTKV